MRTEDFQDDFDDLDANTAILEAEAEHEAAFDEDNPIEDFDLSLFM